MSEEKLSKEQIQQQYKDGVAFLGERVYRTLMPLLDILGACNRIAFLNQEMQKRITEEAECQKAKEKAPELQAVPSGI